MLVFLPSGEFSPAVGSRCVTLSVGGREPTPLKTHTECDDGAKYKHDDGMIVYVPRALITLARSTGRDRVPMQVTVEVFPTALKWWAATPTGRLQPRKLVGSVEVQLDLSSSAATTPGLELVESKLANRGLRGLDLVLLIAHYDHDISWVRQQPWPYIVYEKHPARIAQLDARSRVGPAKHAVRINTAREVPVYLKYHRPPCMPPMAWRGVLDHLSVCAVDLRIVSCKCHPIHLILDK
jgi:hypothetical protein